MAAAAGFISRENHFNSNTEPNKMNYTPHYPLLPYYQQIVSHLPGSWTLEPVSPEFTDADFRAYSAEACLHFRHENGRVTARPSVPESLHQHQDNHALECKTTFNVERSPALAAGQITRAILPEAVRRLALARERKASVDPLPL